MKSSMFKEISQDLLEESDVENIVVKFFISNAANDIAKEWGLEPRFSESMINSKVNGLNVISQYTAYEKGQGRLIPVTYVITESGDIYKTKFKTEKAEGRTFTGDEYVQNYQSSYVDSVKVAKLENRVFYKNDEQVTEEMIEQCAAELVDICSEFNKA